MSDQINQRRSDEPALPVRSGELLAATDCELMQELIRRNDERLSRDPKWVPFDRLRTLLFDAGKILAEWHGRGC